MDGVRVKVTRGLPIGGKWYRAGTVLEVSEAQWQRLRRSGCLKRVRQPEHLPPAEKVAA
jgi:hypothetical protein